MLLAALAASVPATAREVVNASPPAAVSVTVYRDSEREDDAMDLNWLNGFALVSETRTVNLPAGESKIRFDNVAESMVAVSAIVTGLPGGTIEKNRNADILSPAALVDGTLGNRVTMTRTNPATGRESSEAATVMTRADGGLVLRTAAGYEAVRCSGLPERLSFDRVPAGLSANPVYSVDTRSDSGGTYTVTLTYLASGFDWDAHYVATLAEAGLERERKLRLTAWLTVANGNGQGFADAELLAVAGKLEISSDYRELSQPPRAAPLRLTCFAQSIAAGRYPASVPPPQMVAMDMADQIVVTAMKREGAMAEAPIAVTAIEEALGDLKLYRVPVPVTVAARAQKQVAFLDLGAVSGNLVHRADCTPSVDTIERRADIVLRTRNDAANGLGRALPAGGLTVFEPSAWGPLLVAESAMDDRAVGQEVEIGIAATSQVSVTCKPGKGEVADDLDLLDGKVHAFEASITNASDETAEVELRLGNPAQWEFGKVRGKAIMQNGLRVVRIRVPPQGSRKVGWTVRGTQ